MWYVVNICYITGSLCVGFKLILMLFFLSLNFNGYFDGENLYSVKALVSSALVSLGEFIISISPNLHIFGLWEETHAYTVKTCQLHALSLNNKHFAY